jgi:membrane peptidoglycan carboxypeptidase
LASEVERRYTKDQILEMYLNDAPYGGNFYGIGSAAKGYFGKDPKDLNLAESAFLAGLPQSPSRYSPFIGDEKAGKSRAKDVLRRMREDGKITKVEEEKAGKQIDAMKFTTPKLAINAPHFVFYVKDLIEKEYGSKMLDQGLKVKTTLSLDVQNAVQEILTDEVSKLEDYKVGNAAAVVMDSKTGEILAMVGSYDY